MGRTRYGTRISIRRGAAKAAYAAYQAGMSYSTSTLFLTKPLDMGSNKIINLTDGTNPQDAAAFNQAGGVSGTEPVDIQSVYFDDLNNVTDGQLDKGELVTFSTGSTGIVKAAGSSRNVVGVMAEDAAAGASAKVIYAGRCQIWLSGSDGPGDYVKMSSTAGLGQTITGVQSGRFAILEEDGPGGTPALTWCAFSLPTEIY